MIRLGERYPDRFGHYSRRLWGITSSDSRSGYRDWGGPYQQDRWEPDRGIDGTVVPSAAGGAVAIVPELALETLRYQYDEFGEQVYGRYGFANAFHPDGWVSQDVIGIDTGITLLMIENRLTGGVWNRFMRSDIANAGLKRAGFRTIAST